MMKFIDYLRTDLYKIKRQPMLLIHLLVPLAGIILFLAYYYYTSWLPVAKVCAFLETLVVAYPVLIGIVCSLAAEQESAAGNFQQMLTAPVKLLPFYSMLTMLLLLGFAAVLLAAGGFGAGFIAILHKTPFNLAFYIRAASILFGGSIFLYILHLIVSLRFSGGASIGAGILESLISALLLTGLGDGKWQFIPCAWGARFITIYTQYEAGTGNLPLVMSELRVGIIFCVGATILLFISACVWFLRWEGRKSEE